MFYVYVLQSKLNSQIYIGSTNDLKYRVSEHNKGKIFSTKRYKPWKLIYYEAYINEQSARMRESRLKHHGNAVKELKKRIGIVLPISTNFKKNGAGFTLIELLVVVAILGILAVGVMVLLNPVAQIQKSRDAQRKSDLAQIQKVLEQYYNDKGRYPFSSDGFFSGSGACATVIPYRIAAVSSIDGCIDWGQVWTAYNTTLPIDPTSSSRNYVYFVSTDGQLYRLYANLERGSNDPQICKNLDANGECPGVSGMYIKSCGKTPAKPCNYGVSSPNTRP